MAPLIPEGLGRGVSKVHLHLLLMFKFPVIKSEPFNFNRAHFYTNSLLWAVTEKSQSNCQTLPNPKIEPRISCPAVTLAINKLTSHE